MTLWQANHAVSWQECQSITLFFKILQQVLKSTSERSFENPVWKTVGHLILGNHMFQVPLVDNFALIMLRKQLLQVQDDFSWHILPWLCWASAKTYMDIQHTLYLLNWMPVFSSCEIQWFQTLIHTGFHRFKKSVRFFMNTYIINEKNFPS